MSPDLRFELLAIASIVSFLVMGGMLGLWAATSRWHWFARAMVVVCLLAIVQWRPLYELYLTLSTQVATIAVGVAIYRREFWRWRFSVAGLLQVMVVMAVVLASLMREAEKEFTWQSGLMGVGLGVVGGLLTLLGAWLVVTGVRWKWRIPVAVLVIASLGFAWSFSDYLSQTFLESYGQVLWLPWIVSGPSMSIHPTAWLGSLVLVVVIIAITLLVRRFRLLGITVALLLTPFPAYLIYCLATPLLIPPPQPPSRAYRELMALETDPRFQPIHNLEAQDEIDQKAMDTAVAAAEAAFARLHELLQEVVDPGYQLLSQDLATLQANRNIANLLNRRVETSRLAGEARDTARWCRDFWAFTRSLDRPGTITDALVQGAIEGVAVHATYHSIDLLDRDDCLALAGLIADANADRTPAETILQCNRIHEENADGWRGNWVVLLQDVAGFDWIDALLIGRRQQQESTAALLSTELALRTFYLVHGKYPEGLKELVPAHLSELPIDPCSPTGQPLVYHKLQDGFLLYARGYDGDDDNGKPPAEQYLWYTDADLSLKDYFKEE